MALHAAALDALGRRVCRHTTPRPPAPPERATARPTAAACVCVGRVPAAGSTLLLGLTVGGAHVRGSPIRAARARAAPRARGTASSWARRRRRWSRAAPPSLRFCARDAQGNWCGRRARADARVRLLLRGPARVTEAEAVEERTPAGSGGLRLRAG